MRFTHVLRDRRVFVASIGACLLLLFRQMGKPYIHKKDEVLEEELETVKITDQVFLDIQIAGAHAGKIVIGLLGDIVPKTTANFKALAEGFTDNSGRHWQYKGSHFHRVIKSYMILAGDVVEGNGNGSISIYGHHFEHENHRLKHYGAGWVNMMNSAPGQNGCQFAIITSPVATDWLDNRCVVIGKVLAGMDVVTAIENVETDGIGHTQQEIVISDSGLLEVDDVITLDLSVEYNA